MHACMYACMHVCMFRACKHRANLRARYLRVSTRASVVPIFYTSVCSRSWAGRGGGEFSCALNVHLAHSVRWIRMSPKNPERYGIQFTQAIAIFTHKAEPSIIKRHIPEVVWTLWVCPHLPSGHRPVPEIGEPQLILRYLVNTLGIAPGLSFVYTGLPAANSNTSNTRRMSQYSGLDHQNSSFGLQYTIKCYKSVEEPSEIPSVPSIRRTGMPGKYRGCGLRWSRGLTFECVELLD